MLNFNQNYYPSISNLGCASKYIEDIWECIDQIDLLHTFSRDELTGICQYLQCYAAPRDFLLFEPNKPANHLILVLSGGVRLTEKGLHGDVSTNCLLGASLFEWSLVDNHASYATVVTILPTDFAILTQDALNQMLIFHPRLANKLLLILMKKIALRLRAVVESINYENAQLA